MKPIVTSEAINIRVYLSAEDLEFLSPIVEAGQLSRAGALALVARAGLDAVRDRGQLTLPLKLAVESPPAQREPARGKAKAG